MDIQTQAAITEGQLERQQRHLQAINGAFYALILDALDTNNPRPDIANALGGLCEEVTGEAPSKPAPSRQRKSRRAAPLKVAA